MTWLDDPPPPPPTPVPSRTEPAALVLPRPNLGPEPWSEPVATSGAIGLIMGSILLVGLLGLAVRQWRRRDNRRRAVGAPIEPVDHADLPPSHRLIVSSAAVRTALIAEFGAAWAARTTEEIALDPSLPDRLGAATARRLVDYLEQVDRAKFAGEEFSDVDAWIAIAREFLTRFPAPAPVPRRTP